MLFVIGLSVFFVLSCSRDAACRVRLLLVCFCSHAFLFSRRLRKERRVFCIHAGAGGVASFATTEGAEVGEGGAKRSFRESIEYTFVSFEGSNPHCDARTGWGEVHTPKKNLYIPLCTVLGGEILVSPRLGPRMESPVNMNEQAHDNMSAPPRQNDGDDGCSKCTATPPIFIL